MKLKLIQLLMLMLCLSATSFADEQQVNFEIPEDEDLDSLEADEQLLREIEEKHNMADTQRENENAAKIAADFSSQMLNNAPIQADPCEKIRCGAGKICEANGTTASCVCIPECPHQSDPRRMVCTNRNETWNSDCEVHRERCLCDANDSRCRSSEFKHIHIDYYGQCKEMPTCSEEEMSDFPRRMRDWLFNVMTDLAQNEDLPLKYKTLQSEAENNITRRWTNAAIWKWCDLDGHPHDKSVSLHELFPIRAPLMSLEHCIAPFLESCDPNGDHRITLEEWGKCLQLNEGDMEDRCETLKSDN